MPCQNIGIGKWSGHGRQIKQMSLKLALDNRVLSLYTAFLALEPGIGAMLFLCKDDDGVLINVQDEVDGIASDFFTQIHSEK